MKRNLYIDCDGVILDTVTIAFSKMKNEGVDLSNQNAIDDYFVRANWKDLINQGGPINDSYSKILFIKDSLEFELVCVLTHRCSYNEGVIKTDNFDEMIPGVKVITVPKKIQKNWAVLPDGHFLIDDSTDKINKWIQAGGIGVLFSQKTDHLIYPYELNENQPYFITNNLLDILTINDFYKEKSFTK